MRKWLMNLEILENEDDFFKDLDYANQHKVLKNFILDVLHANGFESRVRLTKYSEEYDADGEFDEYKAPEQPAKK